MTNSIKPNQSPTSDAGPNRNLTLPTNSITINGAGSDPDGSIASYSWKQISGPSTARLSGTNSSDLVARDLIEGRYVFRLTVTDKLGLTDEDDMQVTVNQEPVNQAPSADAGPNRSLTLPNNSITIKGVGSDATGSVASYSWKQISGPSTARLSGTNSADLIARDLIEGRYVFRLTVTDNLGLTDEDEMQVTVRQAAANEAPSADAGPNKIFTLPKNQITLNGSGTDNDGTIAGVQWKQISGPTAATLSGTKTINLVIKDFVEGVYKFELEVTDNTGDTDTDQVAVTALAAPPSIAAEITEATCAANDGTISLTLSGGKGPFSYKWSNGTTTKNLSQVVSGNYQVTVTDGNGRSTKKSFSVSSVKANLKINASIKNATCSDNNGSIKVETSGGTGPYNYEWSSNARTSSLNKLSGGSYSLVVTDQNGCNKKFSIKVGIDPGVVVHTINSSIENTSCAGNDGSISLKATGTEGPYSFVWSHGATGPNLNSLEDGKYRVTIADKHGCYMESEYTINQNPGPAKPSIAQSGDSLYVAQQASSYQWFKDNTTIAGANQRHLNYTEAGTYSVQIFNEKNCMASSDYFYAKDPPSSIFNNGSFTIQQADFYPNPVVEDINVRLYLNEPAATNITIYDFQGRVMLTRDLGVINSQIIENIRVDQFPAGTYVIRARANKEIVTARFIKP